MKKLLSALFNHERYQSIAVVCVAVFLVFMYSCRPKCRSIFDPARQITREELNGEVALLQSRINNELDNLEQQEAIRTLLLSLAQNYAATGVFNPLSALTGAIALLGTGAVIDNARKRKEIKKLLTYTTESCLLRYM